MKENTMFAKLLPIFILTPLIELMLLLEVGERFGAMNTIMVVIITGVIGAYLTKMQGFNILFKIRLQLQNGQFPGDSLIEGVIILIGGLTLLTPGFITDVFGFLCLIPVSRQFLQDMIKKQISKRFGTTENKSDATDAEFWIDEE